MNDHNADDGRNRAMTTFLNRMGFNVDLDAAVEEELEDDRSKYDDALFQVWKAGLGIRIIRRELLRDIHFRDPDDELEMASDAENIDKVMDSLEKAVLSAGEIVERAEEDSDLRKDLSKLDPELLREARGELVYIAHHLGIEVSLPAPDAGSA